MPLLPDRNQVEQARRRAEAGDSLSAIARDLNVSRPTVQHWRNRGWTFPWPVHEGQRDFDPPVLDDFDPPVERLIEHHIERFDQLQKAKASRKWMRFEMKDDKPFGLAVIGDPHMDDDGCNWRLLRDHHALMRETKGVYCIGMGDYINNWTGRLASLHGQQSTSARVAFKYAEWFFGSLPWLLILAGNHDAWSTKHGNGNPMDFMRRGPIPLEDWQARFIVACPGGAEVRVHARHDFKGNSIWNDMHGLVRSAKMGDEADILLAGHKHIWGTVRGEHNGRVFTAVRASGYKEVDDYAENLQFPRQNHGQTVLLICDPTQLGTARVQVHEDLARGCEMLTLMRK